MTSEISPRWETRWEKITQCKEDSNLQSMYSFEEAKQKYLKDCSPCPTCGRSVKRLSWVYYLDQESWPSQSGWMTVCNKDKKEVDFFIERQEFFPWEIVETARKNESLQSKIKSNTDMPKGYINFPCPNCKQQRLLWFWFVSPEEDWDSLAGIAGWLCACDNCHFQVKFNVEVMS